MYMSKEKTFINYNNSVRDFLHQGWTAAIMSKNFFFNKSVLNALQHCRNFGVNSFSQNK